MKMKRLWKSLWMWLSKSPFLIRSAWSLSSTNDSSIWPITTAATVIEHANTKIPASCPAKRSAKGTVFGCHLSLTAATVIEHANTKRNTTRYHLACSFPSSHVDVMSWKNKDYRSGGRSALWRLCILRNVCHQSIHECQRKKIGRRWDGKTWTVWEAEIPLALNRSRFLLPILCGFSNQP